MPNGERPTEPDPAAGDAQIRTFLIADVRGYTVFTQERGDEAAAELAGRFAAVAREGVEAHDGTVVELRGDEALAVFASTRQAIRAAVELQRRFVDATVADPAFPLAVGIGLDAGEAVPVGDGFRGGALNLAARLCSIAGPGEVLASREVVHLARKVEGVASVDRGSVRLKGLADAVHVIRLRAEANDAAEDVAFRRALGTRAARLAPAGPGAIAANPYKGLRAFEEADAEDFFGREGLIEQLVERLASTRFLAVVGPSGSGKSSVVRAGLVPALRRGAIPGSERWPIVDMFPGSHPLDALEAALLRATPDPPASLMDQLERDEHGLHRAVLRLLPSDGSELVLVIDQFEETFTLVEDEAARTHFLESLEFAATDPHSRLRVVVTLRADFYDRPLRYRGFAELFRSRVEALVPLSPEELERVISAPAAKADVALEPGLVAAMLADVAEEPGALPLLEYALTELFDRRDGRMLTLETYREIGGVAGALGRRAEELHGALDADGREAARQLFLRMVALGEGSEDTRRRVPRAEVASLGVDQGAMAAVIDTFGASRQLSFDRDARTGAPTIELAHEAILTAWPRLARWIDAARDDVRTERRVAAAASEWDEAGRDPSFLLSGSRLQQVDAWREATGLALTPEERAFIDASMAERDRQRVDEAVREARERDLERRSVRRLRALVAVLTAAAVVAGGLTLVATGQRRRAEEQERTAVARELAAASAANLEEDPERAVLLALEAVDRTRSVDGTVLPEALGALHRAVTASRIVLTSPDAGGNLDWSPDGVFVTEGPEDTGMIDVRDATTGETVRTWEGHAIDVNDVRFSDDGSMLATAGDDGVLKLWDPASGEPVSTVQGVGPVLGPSFSADGALVAASWPDEELVRVADPATGRIVAALEEPLDGLPTDTALSPDGRRLALAFAFTDVGAVFDVTSGGTLERAFLLRGHAYPVNGIAWSPDGRRIATAGDDAAVHVWDARTGRLEAELAGHTGTVITVDWAPDSGRLVSGGADGTARVWEVGATEGRQLLTLTAQQTRSGTFAAFSPDGSRVLTGDLAITAVKIWDVTPSGDAEVANLETDELAPVDVAYLPGDRIVAPIDRGSVAVWDRDGERVATIGPGAGSPEPVWKIAASDDGTRIATVRDFSGTVSAWDVGSGDLLYEVDVGAEVSSLDLSPDGEHLVVGTFDQRSIVLGPDGRRVAGLDEGEGFGVEGVAFSPDGRWIATAVVQPVRPSLMHVSLWDLERVRKKATVRVLGPTGVAFDPSGSELAVARFDGQVQILTVPGLEPVRRFAAHSGGVTDLTYSPDGARIATAGEDATVRLFNAQGVQQLVLRGHGFLVSGVAFSPDGRRLASAAPDGTVRIWALDLDDLIRIARSQVTRELSDEECRQFLHGPCR